MEMSTDSSLRKVIVFAGNTVMPQTLTGAFPDAASRLVLQPPAGLGDVWRHIRADVSAMVVIDCCHSDAPSVWHREIRSALDAGIAVFGAGGIGTLRAAELYGIGMTGVGTVFDRVQNGLLEADDEVLSGPDGFALVTFRMVLEQALQAGVMTPDEIKSLMMQSRSCFYAERTWHHVARWLKEAVAPDRRERAALFLKMHAADPRPDDAIEAIRLALSGFRSPVFLEDATNPMTEMVRPKWRLSEFFYRTFLVNGKAASGADVLQRADALRTAWIPRLRKAFFVRQWLREQGLAPPPSFVEAFVRRAVAAQSGRLVNFLLENGLTLSEWERLLAQESIVTWADQERAVLLPDLSGEACFAEAWAGAHGVVAPADSGRPAGEWAMAKGPRYFGFVWEESVAFLDAVRLSGRAAHFAVRAGEGGTCDV
ncbi:MAG: TfuA-like protein [Desulfobacterales bacterium]